MQVTFTELHTEKQRKHGHARILDLWSKGFTDSGPPLIAAGHPSLQAISLVTSALRSCTVLKTKDDDRTPVFRYGTVGVGIRESKPKILAWTQKPWVKESR